MSKRDNGGFGYVYKRRYPRTRTIDMGVIDALAERVVAKGVAEMDRSVAAATIERPAVPQWFSKTETEETEMRKCEHCNGTGNEPGDDLAKFNDTIQKGFDVIMERHPMPADVRKAQFAAYERDKKLSALVRAERETKQKMGLL